MKNQNGKKEPKNPNKKVTQGRGQQWKQESVQHRHSVCKQQALMLTGCTRRSRTGLKEPAGNGGEKEQPAAAARVLAVYVNSKVAFTK